MSAWDHPRPNWAIRATSGLPPTATESRTSQLSLFDNCSALVRYKMAAIAKVLSQAIGTEIDVDTLRPVLILSGAGLLLSLLMMMYGCDLSVSDWLPPA